MRSYCSYLINTLAGSRCVDPGVRASKDTGIRGLCGHVRLAECHLCSNGRWVSSFSRSSPMAAVGRMIEMAEIKPGDVVFDLGCGDGRIVVAAAKLHGVKAVGVDISAERVAESRERALAAGVEDLVEIRQADIFDLDLDRADVVFLYLTPRLNERLMPQLRRLKPGARIISYEFDMGAAKPVEVVRERFDQFGEQKIYKWVVPWKEFAGSAWDIFTLRP